MRLVEDPRPCTYLPEQTAALEYRLATDLSPDEWGRLLARGYRRQGCQIYRPACPSCRQCVPLRVPLKAFRLDRAQRRTMVRNQAIRAEIYPLFVTTQHLDLYRRYHRFMSSHRGWPSQDDDLAKYAHSFLACGGEFGRQWLYFDGGHLVGVALMDEVPDAISLVYFFHDPDWRPQGPGTYSILTQIDYARRQGFDYAYLGYWIGANQSMKYKSRFRPHEVLVGYPADHEEPNWIAPSP